MKLINGQRDDLEKEVFEMILDGFKPGSTNDHESIMASIDRLKSQGKLNPVSQKNSLPQSE